MTCLDLKLLSVMANCFAVFLSVDTIDKHWHLVKLECKNLVQLLECCSFIHSFIHSG